jgi:hypothetical protein
MRSASRSSTRVYLRSRGSLVGAAAQMVHEMRPGVPTATIWAPCSKQFWAHRRAASQRQDLHVSKTRQAAQFISRTGRPVRARQALAPAPGSRNYVGFQLLQDAVPKAAVLPLPVLASADPGHWSPAAAGTAAGSVISWWRGCRDWPACARHLERVWQRRSDAGFFFLDGEQVTTGASIEAEMAGHGAMHCRFPGA